jgi:glycosyltransferase involved in cell wall biosynthesis
MLVSVVIPSYNHAPYLRACLESVLAQTYTTWEVVLVDDKSSDDSIPIARQYESERVRVFENEHNLGTYGTQARGLDLARGDAVAILNSDDLWAPEKLEKQVQLLERHKEAPFCYTLGWKIDENGRVDETEDVHADWPRDELQNVLPHLLCENRVLASSVLFRREAVSFETTCRYSGDWVALLRLARKGPAACVPERLSFWRMHSANTFTRSRGQAIEEIRVRKSIDLASGMLPVEQPSIRRGLGMNAMNLAALYVLFKDMRTARSWAGRAMKWHTEKPLALRRLAVTMLPFPQALNRLWPGEEPLGEPDDVPPLDPIQLI